MPLTSRVPAIALAAVAALGVGGAAASAHPFGPPLTATLTAEGTTVEVVWSGAEDDWMALGEWTGAFAAAGEESRTGTQILMECPEVRDYLLDNIAVTQQGQDCAGTWEGIEDLLDTGATLHFDCPTPVTTVDVSVTALTDINEAYRTVVTAGGQQTLFTATDPHHALDITQTAGDADRAPVLMLSSAGVAVLAVGAAWAFTARRRTRSAA